MVTKEYWVKVFNTEEELEYAQNYLDLKESTNLREIIKQTEEYIKENVIYAVDIIEFNLNPQTRKEIDSQILLSFTNDSISNEPIDKIDWSFEGMVESEYNDIMKEEQEDIECNDCM